MDRNVKLLCTLVSRPLKLIRYKMNVFIGYPLSYQWELACYRLPATTVTCSAPPACLCSILLQETKCMHQSSDIFSLFLLSLVHWKM